MSYNFETTVENIVKQAEFGVRPVLKEMLTKRLQQAADEALAKAKIDIDQAIKDIAYQIADSLEARIVSARSPDAFEDIQIVVMIDRKEQRRHTSVKDGDNCVGVRPTPPAGRIVSEGK
jgi:hypothetical protein